MADYETVRAEMSDPARLRVERDAAQAALVKQERRHERRLVLLREANKALKLMLDSCGKHVEDVIAAEDAPEMFADIDRARSVVRKIAEEEFA
jgi:hypothetical protein